MESYRCRVCGRPLRSPESIKAGMGPVCAGKKAKQNIPQEEPRPLDEEPKTPRVADVSLWRGDGGAAEVNVPRSVVWHSPTGFEWGYGGSGPADLALNILNAFVPPGADGERAVSCPSGRCSHTAARLHQDFKREFIVSMPPEGGIIRAEDIRLWLGDRGVTVGKRTTE